MSSDNDPLARIRAIPDPAERALRAAAAHDKASALAHAAAAIRAAAVLQMSSSMTSQQIADRLGISRTRADQLMREGKKRDGQ